jgi:uncharacterized protein YukE
MDSNAVLSYLRNMQQLITDAQRCHSGMDQAIVGISGYWTDLGSDEFTRNCKEWSKQMKELEQTLRSISSSMQSYASKLSDDERKADEQKAAQAKADAQAKSGAKSK